jgi:hypothetical protein
MACIITEICLLVLGIITLVTGKINVSGSKMVVGAPARWIGAILLLPLPLSFSVGFVWGMLLAAQGRIPNRQEIQTIGAVIEIGIFALCMVTVGIITAASQKVPVKKPEKRTRTEEEYEEEEYERRRPALAREREEEEYERPRPPPLPRGYSDQFVDRATTPEVIPELSPVRVQCTSCNGIVGIPENAVGKSVQCPLCSAIFVAQPGPAVVRIQCSHCKKDLSVPASAFGKSVKCPLCAEIFTAQPATESGFRE